MRQGGEVTEKTHIEWTQQIGVDLSRDGDEAVIMLVGKDTLHSGKITRQQIHVEKNPNNCYATMKPISLDDIKRVEDIVREGIETGWEVGRLAREIWERKPLGMQFFDGGNYDSFGRRNGIAAKDARGRDRIEFKQLVMAEFPDMETSAIDYEAHVRGRELRRMQGAQVHIDGILVGTVDQIQVEQRSAGAFGGRTHVIGELKFLGNMEGINALVEAQFNHRRGGGIALPPARRKPMAEAKPYEKKNITALVYRTYPTIEAIEETRRHFNPSPLSPATRTNDPQMVFIGFVYDGETPEQIIAEDVEKTSPIRVNEDRTYLVFDAPGVVEVEGPKSRMTTRRKSGGAMGTTDSPR